MATRQSTPSKKKTTKKTPKKKTAAKRPTKRASAPAAKKSVKKAAAPANPPGVTLQRRWEMIAEAAYYKAERRGFAGGDTSADWSEAEAEIDAMLATREP